MSAALSFKNPEALLAYAEKVKKYRQQRTMEIRVCAGPGCIARGGREIFSAIKATIEKNKKELKKKNLEVGVKFEAKCTGCHGLCEAGPVVTFEPSKLFYSKVKIKDAEEIVEKTVLNDEIIKRLLFKSCDSRGGDLIKKYTDIRFYALQTKVALRNVGVVDPSNLDDFIAEDGFKAFVKALTEMSPDDVIEEIEKSGLRGRGGAGFSTGKKWRSAKRVKQDRVWIICNGDEGDPGAFMDRAIMEGDPYSVIEGLLIGAYALGATDGFIYVRHEYPLAVKHLQMAINTLEKAGLLGKNILGTGMTFNLKISRGGGAFVCGESSALMRSLEGKVGEPRAKYIRSVEKGLLDQPTVLNNVETFTCVPAIIDKGSSWFASIGPKSSTGTKAFSLVGKVKNTGLVEVPMGRTLREIIFDIGGGIIDDRPFKAVQTGGPSGGCLPVDKLDLPVDFDTLSRAGAMMGSGGMIVMDDRTCMVDIADYFIRFLIGESCGKCVPCREGLRQVHELLDRIIRGDGELDDLKKIDRLCHTMEVASLCALGKSAPYPVTSTIKYFRDEYMAHIEEKKCPAGVCKSLVKYDINKDCIGCLICKKQCPVDAISGENKKLHVIDQDKCIVCGICYEVCPVDTVDIISGGEIVNRRELEVVNP
ncbi:MAG: NADH-ubiquinone oxidoreductase-F iron-sulfur binding region domain-containing protein [Candidatus Electryonea clarkiae]|nr:NADH-ubiquinone oxidoreductase-F iron-sulfur binding region domain-containing protein [Candidatus Electryonea clarkiae]MDP8286863.1 NADH-ubiquinone oxidoreductase-F iron-sulfur binding region domain-containing protein [Candidatus Electryonea clarkiae]